MDDFLRRLQEQQEMFRRLAEGPLRYIRDNEATIRRMHELARGVDTSQLQRGVEVIGSVAKSLPFAAVSELTSAAFATSFAVPESVREMQRYADQHREIVESVNHLSTPARTLAEQVESMSRFIDASSFAASTIDADRIGELIHAAERERGVVARVTNRLTLRYADLIVSLNLPEGRLASVPSFVSEMPTVDVFVHTEAVRIITPHRSRDPEQESTTASLRLEVVDDTVAFLEIVLPELHPPLLSQYRGAKACAAEKGPDWWTHGGASLRKLLKGVLHTAAPNDTVLPWARQNNKELDRLGRPIRATKVEWLCSFIPNDAYRAYVRTELNSALALIDLLDTAQHVDEFQEFEAQYAWTVLRVEVAIRHMLTIWRAGQSR
jgi:hypothetical protein